MLVTNETVLTIDGLYTLLSNSEWITMNGTDVIYSFTDLERTEVMLSGILYVGVKLVEFEIGQDSITYNSFTIDKYILQVQDMNNITVYVRGDERQPIDVERVF